MKIGNSVRTFLAVAVLVMVAACATAPVEEVDSYLVRCWNGDGLQVFEGWVVEEIETDDDSIGWVRQYNLVDGTGFVLTVGTCAQAYNGVSVS